MLMMDAESYSGSEMWNSNTQQICMSLINFSLLLHHCDKLSKNMHEKNFRDSDLEENNFVCEICDQRLLLKTALKKHILRHLAEEKSVRDADDMYCRYSCAGCNRTFSSESKLLCHKSRFPGFHKFPCDKCGVSFPNRKKHDRHVSAKHLCASEKSRKIVTCDICSENFSDLKLLQAHVDETHISESHNKENNKKRTLRKGSSSNTCKTCSLSFPSKKSLEAHLKTHLVKKTVKPRPGHYRCLICPRSFSSSDGIKYHLATHTGEKRYGCDQCNRRFIKKTHLTEHVATHSDVKYFTCEKCPRCFSTLSAYKKHVKMFPGDHNFFCNKCGKTFMKESMLQKHLCVDLVAVALAPEVVAQLSEDVVEEYMCLAEEADKEAAVKGYIPCCKCFKMFPNESALHDHQNEHLLQRMYQCRFCPEAFNRSDVFSTHIVNHLGSTPYMCRQCNRKFISPITLATHLKNYPGEHSFSCKRCKRWFPSADRLEKHDCILQNLDAFVCACHSEFHEWQTFIGHLGKKPFKCCSCPLEFLSAIALTRHIKWHTGNRPFHCKVCSKNFITKTSFRSHLKIHENSTLLSCTQCDYKTVHQKRLDFHIAKRHEIPSSTLCPVCGMMFPKLSKLTKHLQTEHGQTSNLASDESQNKSQSAELCTICGKMLTNKYSLRAHMKNQHSSKDSAENNGEDNDGPVSCSVCNQLCYTQKLLRKHMRKHDTNKPFACPRCGKQFKVSVSLKYHATICGQQRQKKHREKSQPETVDTDKWSYEFN